MKKIILLVILSILICCSSQEVIEKKDLRPDFEFQKTYILRQVPFSFSTYYNVWKYLPITFIEFEKPKDMRKAKYFNIRQQISLVGNNFVVRDIENSRKYLLKEELIDTTDDLITYSIIQDEKILGTITQSDKYSILDYDFKYNEEVYSISGEMKKSSGNILAFTFNISDKEILFCKIIKEYLYFQNEYEIILNREYSKLDDYIYICIGVFIDQILKENGYQYKK